MTTYSWQEGEPWTQPRHFADPAFNAPDQPVVSVSWHEAMAFCLWLSIESGDRISLPTEAQWQYAAQGEQGFLYPWGNEWECQRCNNSAPPCTSDRTTPVTQYEGIGDSPFGVVDMAGNVWEWCLDDSKAETPPADDDGVRGIKGGGWMFFSKADCRTTFRYPDVPHSWFNFRGFRTILAA